jgi:hypothetical protein
MKTILNFITQPFLLVADQMRDVMGEMTDVMQDAAAATDSIMSHLSWKMKLMLYWDSLSSMHKVVIVAVIALIVFFIVKKLFGCHKKCD